MPPTPTHIDAEAAAHALLIGRANQRRAEALVELIRWQSVPLTETERQILAALLEVGARRPPEVF